MITALGTGGQGNAGLYERVNPQLRIDVRIPSSECEATLHQSPQIWRHQFQRDYHKRRSAVCIPRPASAMRGSIGGGGDFPVVGGGDGQLAAVLAPELGALDDTKAELSMINSHAPLTKQSTKFDRSIGIRTPDLAEDHERYGRRLAAEHSSDLIKFVLVGHYPGADDPAGPKVVFR